MRCPECDHANVSSAECCAECGTPLPPADTTIHPGETFRDPDDLSFPAEHDPGARRRSSVGPLHAVEPPSELSLPDDDREPRFLDSRRPKPLDATPTMRDIASNLRPDDARAERAVPVRYAGFIRRGFAFVIDLIVLGIFTVPLTVAGLAAVRTALAFADLPRSFATDDALTPLLGAGCSAMFIAYFTILHAGGGQTIGKAALGIGVRSADLRTIGVSRSFLRVLGYFASAALFGLGFLMIAFTPHRRGWHDYVAGTCVVRLVPKEV